jgi:putative holliday junction resolvase
VIPPGIATPGSEVGALAGGAVIAVPPAGRVLGVDLGTKRIGVAISDAGQRLATGLTVVARAGDMAAVRRTLARLVEDEEVVAVVVGMPRSLDGSLGPAARHALDEVAELRGVLKVPVETQDERLTTVAAAGALRAGGVSSRARRGVIDQVAAAVTLQTWLDRRRTV